MWLLGLQYHLGADGGDLLVLIASGPQMESDLDSERGVHIHLFEVDHGVLCST